MSVREPDIGPGWHQCDPVGFSGDNDDFVRPGRADYRADNQRDRSGLSSGWFDIVLHCDCLVQSRRWTQLCCALHVGLEFSISRKFVCDASPVSRLALTTPWPAQTRGKQRAEPRPNPPTRASIDVTRYLITADYRQHPDQLLLAGSQPMVRYKRGIAELEDPDFSKRSMTPVGLGEQAPKPFSQVHHTVSQHPAGLIDERPDRAGGATHQ